MHRHAIRLAACLFVMFLFAAAPLKAQTTPPTDIYEHFIGTWVGSDVYMKDGARRQTDVQIVITENKKKDRLRFDYVYGHKGTPDFNRGTRFLKLDPTKAEFDIWWKGNSKEAYRAIGLDQFATSGFGKFTGFAEYADQPYEERTFRVTFELTDSTFSYEWQNGPDQNNLNFRSRYTVSRSIVAGQP
jgi:hypothetical protein